MTATLPEAERDRFALTTIANAMAARQKEAEARLAAALLADFDPERDAAECRSVVEEGLDDVDAGRDLVSFEEAKRRWEAERVARQSA